MEDNTAASSLQAGWPHGQYIVGVDGSAHSQDALREALSLAALTGARVEAVSTYTYPAFYGDGYVLTDPTLEEGAASILEAAIDEVVGRTRPINLTSRVVQGLPAPTLIDRSRDADLLILGSRGHGGFAGLLLGSVSAACAEHAHCPVLIMHGKETE